MPRLTDTALAPEQLIHRCSPEDLPFRTTDEVSDGPTVVGQARAIEATAFGMRIRRKGYNLFVLGPTGSGKHSVLERLLRARAASEGGPPDYCYVHNFTQAHRPRLLTLPAGLGDKFRDDMSRLVTDLRSTVTDMLESDEYRLRQEEVDQEFNDRRERALSELRDHAAHQNVALIRTPLGLALAPAQDGKVLDPDAFSKLSKAQQQELQSAIGELEADLQRLLRQTPKWQRERRDRLEDLRKAATSTAMDSLIEEMQRAYGEHPQVLEHLTALRTDIIDNAESLAPGRDAGESGPLAALMQRAGGPEFPANRYQVNALGDHAERSGAPVVYEDNPSYHNLFGRIEHIAQMGTLVTDFTLIKPGALHRANGGYLVLDARRVLTEPFAWESLKRALRSREIRIESLAQSLSLITTVSLEPEPIPLDLKVVLIGEERLYYLLHALDPDFKDLFKVAVDFEHLMERTPEGTRLYAGLVANIARDEGLRPLTAAGVARVIDHAARLAGDSTKLSMSVDAVANLLREADYWASQSGDAPVDVHDVQRAIDAQIHRVSRPRDRLQDVITEGTVFIATRGATVGQVNGLSVIDLGGFAFGRPSRITARVRLGRGRVLDIEREVELGGALHSKGVLILSGFLAGRFVPDRPLSLSASLVFEQSYGGIDGDSASSAELYALLSALSDLPVSQSLAVTGSVNQRGDIQAIGGVNEKIEGFFDLCRATELTGEQGVIIPAANTRHLMLRDDVVRAVEEKRFRIHAVEHVDQGIELLTGTPAGEQGPSGEFPEGSVNARVEARLRAFASQAQSFQSPSAGEAS